MPTLNCQQVQNILDELKGLKQDFDVKAEVFLSNPDIKTDKEKADQLWLIKEKIEKAIKELDELWPKTKVGLSLSFCITDILYGNVKEKEVKEIIAGTRVDTPEAWKELIKDY